MPYIPQDRYLEGAHRPATVGELNYVMTCHAIGYVLKHGLRYEHLNHVIGSFEQAIHSDDEESMSGLAITIRNAARNFWNNQPDLLKTGVAGAIKCAQMEFYRRVVGPYEDKAIAKNGDVYPKELLP